MTEKAALVGCIAERPLNLKFGYFDTFYIPLQVMDKVPFTPS